MAYNTRYERSSSNRLDDVKQLPNSASEFYPIHRRSLNLHYVNAANAILLFSKDIADIQINNYLHIKNLTRDELSLVGHRSDILNKLSDDDEKTLALYIYKVIQTDPLTTESRKNLTDSFVNFLLSDLRFNRYPFILNLQPDYNFEVFGKKISAKVEFSIEKNKGVLCFDEDKHLHKIGSTTEYGESQIAAEILACAFTNYDKASSPSRGQDQTIFAIRVIGTKFTFYKAFVSRAYLQSLNDGFPPDDLNVTIQKFPTDEVEETFYGYDYANEQHRPLILELLIRLREHIRKM